MPGRRAARWCALLLSVVVCAAAGAWGLSGPRVDVHETIRRARSAFREQDYAAALQLANQILAVDPDETSALILAAGAEAARRRPVEAWSHYQRLPSPSTPALTAATCVAAHLRFFDLHHPGDAERLYREVLQYEPAHLAANSGLANLLGLTGRRWEAIPPTLELIRQGQCTTNQLILIGSESGGHEDYDLLSRCVQAAPQDPIAALGMAWQARHRGEHAEALRWVDQALRLDPSLTAGHVFQGTLLVETQASPSMVQAWHAAVPASAEEHPELWLTRGHLARQAGVDDVAIRCYWETIRRNPNYREALHQVSQALFREGAATRAQPFVDRIAGLQRLKEAEAVLFEGIQESTKPIQQVAEQLERLGRFWEAWGWCRQAIQIEPQARWPELVMRRFRSRLTAETPLTVWEFNPASEVDLSAYPWSPEVIGRIVTPSAPAGLPPSSETITFRDDAAAVGLDFHYFNSATTAEPGQRMYEFSGGGVAACDLDLDGWCELYFTQGCDWPPAARRTNHLDRLVRQTDTGRFIDVTDSARIAEPGFSQGLATGDYDNDGFPDLYIANIGGNRLFRNLGDGTFEDATSCLPSDPERWTTSVAVADLNGDTWPDLYAANYLEGPDIFERMCQHKDGVARMCAPFDFPGSQDQFLLNQGDGTFRDATSEAGFMVPHGKGLGVLVADFEHRGRLDVFVANDLVPNFYFSNQTAERGAAPRFEDRGLLNGVAFNAAGQAQGCMGIAADDLDGDQRLDLLVTNFYMEPNVLYLQESAGGFRDATQASGLVGPSLTVLGFGTQTVDADLDGRRDLLVTNGHVDDHRAYGQPYGMPAQVFRGFGDGRFVELSAATVGPFFGEQRLGRGMARVDWNRDGREDVVISHLESPAALLTNTSTNSGHALALHLRGVNGDRDAIGARVSVTTPGGRQTRQITAGDGYQANNQRQLVFGLGSAREAATIEIDWPSGHRQTFHQVATGREWLAVETRAELLTYGPPFDASEVTPSSSSLSWRARWSSGTMSRALRKSRSTSPDSHGSLRSPGTDS